MLRNIFLFIAAIVVCATAGAAQSEIRLYAGSTVINSTFSKIKDAFEKKYGIKITYVGFDDMGGSIKYYKQLVDGQLELVAAPDSFEDWKELMLKEGVEPAKLQEITYRVINRESLYVFTNKQAKVTNLSAEDIKGIFSGRIKNWSELRGADLPITLVIPAKKPNLAGAVQRRILGKTEIGAKKIDSMAEDWGLLPADVERVPGGISYSPQKKGLENVTVVQTPDLGRPTTLLSKGKPSDAVMKLTQFIRENK